MTAPQPPRRSRPLPVLRTVFEAYYATLARLPDLKPVALVVAPLLFVALAALSYATWSLEMGSEIPFLLVVVLALPHMLVASLIAALAAVPWHRLMLAGEPVTMAAAVRLDTRMRRYGLAVFWLGLLYTAILVLPPWALSEVLIPALDGPATGSPSPMPDAASDAAPTDGEQGGTAILAIAGLILGLPLLLAAGLVPARLALVLPAIAVGDRTMSVWRSWQLTRGNSWRLVLGAALAMLPGLWGHVASFWLSKDRLWGSIGSAAVEVVWLVAGIVLVTFLSLAYRHFTEGSSGG